MNAGLSVLQNFKPIHFRMDPWPHVCIENALPNDLYARLAQEYPESALAGNGLGFRDFRYRQGEFAAGMVSDTWQQFVAYHNSAQFLHQAVRALEPGMRRYYPDITDKYLSAGTSLRGQGKPRLTAAMEVQFVMNAPDRNDIRSPHLDQNRELFAGLFYMKKPEDRSTGGDLLLYRKKDPDRFKFLPGRIAPLEQIEAVARVPYQANTLCLFLNTADSIHGVGPRLDANHIRRYVNIDCHVIEKLFLLEFQTQDA